jgi:amino acid transporter
MTGDQGAEVMDQQDKDALDRTINQGAPKEHVTSSDEDDLDLSLPGRVEERPGSMPGNVRIRIIMPRHQPFHRIKEGVLEATEAAGVPEGSLAQALNWLKRALIGIPIATMQEEGERLSKFKGFAVLSTDPISSIAYATEAILLVLIVAGSDNLWLILPISLAIVSVLTIVTISYRQVLSAHPQEGGSYSIVRDTLGTLPGLVVATSLVIGYALTASVSIAFALQNLVSLFSMLAPYMVPLDVALVILITILHLRNVHETSFLLPIYLFVASALLLIIAGFIKSFFIQHHPVIGHFQPIAGTEPLTLYLILQSFAAGCSAMTGIEIVPNFVPSFRKPEARNAATTLTWMALILSILFIGITLLATSYHIEANNSGNPTVIAQIAAQVFTGSLFFMYPVFQFTILLILFVVALISSSDFPPLASLLAHERYLPKQFSLRGDRLRCHTDCCVAMQQREKVSSLSA